MARDLQKFCPKCGEEVDELHEGLCSNCHAEGENLVDISGKVEVDVCRNCGRVKLDDWVHIQGDPREEAAVAAVAEELEINGAAEIDLELRNGTVIVRAQGDLPSGVRKEEELEVPVDVETKLCEECSRARGGYYEAVLQIRSEDDEEIEKVIDIVQEVLQDPRGENWFITASEDVQGGVDVYLGSKAMLKELERRVKNMTSEMNKSYELKGEEDGEKVYRNYLAVHL